MSFAELCILAVGLSMDAFAVSICKGLAMTRPDRKTVWIVGLWFGGFQALMPLIGYFAGSHLIQWIRQVDHWVAFIILSLIGMHMLREAFHMQDTDDLPDADISFVTMLLLAIATSIDALAVGITFAALQVHIIAAVSLIGCITFMISAGGVVIGRLYGSRYRKSAEMLGGIILILIGIRILLEHLLG
ncbi:MAG: manganese efflux pump [Eubacterium sp.]|nr:manganese efflux pump [Eubacterium sp.]MBQ9321714.1 manganese efflux pump [Eubacterium sp.]